MGVGVDDFLLEVAPVAGIQPRGVMLRPENGPPLRFDADTAEALGELLVAAARATRLMNVRPKT